MEANRSLHNVLNSSLLGLILIVAAFVSVTAGARYYLVDDAYISFRYAYNLVHHGVLVFNLGERVEGITNLLWTVLLAVAHRLFTIPIEQAALFLSLAFLFMTCLQLWRLGPLLGTTPLAGALAGILLITNKDFFNAATNGLEVALYTFLLVEIIYRYCRGQWKLAYTFAALLMLTRPEGLLFGLLLIGLVYAKTKSVREAAIGVLIIGGVTLSVTAYRWFTYGALLPNSVIAKSFPLRYLSGLSKSIISYLVGFTKDNVYFVILAIAASFSLMQTRSRRGRPTEVLVLCLSGILSSIVVMTRNGADWIHNHRLLSQYGVLYAVLMVVLLGHRRLLVFLATAIVTLSFLQTVNGFIHYRPQWIPEYTEESFPYPAEIPYREVAARLAPILKSDDTVSAEAIGYISYHLINTTFHDPLGLTNAYIARHGSPSVPYGKLDNQYLVKKLKPSVMIWHYAGNTKFISPKQRNKYETYCLGPCDNWNSFIVMIRADRVDDLGPAFSDWNTIDLNHDWPK